jgi:hypothetical protein
MDATTKIICDDEQIIELRAALGAILISDEKGFDDPESLIYQLKLSLSAFERLEKFTRSTRAAASQVAPRPKIVCLCGSTRFMEVFFEAGWRETLAGKIVLSVGVCKHAAHHGAEALGEDVVKRLDDLHKRKIDLADEVLVLNVGGYIGDSTRSEIEYATRNNKPIRWLEKPKGETK